MNFTRLITRDFLHYRKAFLAILAGMLVSTAVLTGALMLGDSVDFSLRHFANVRLGKIKYALNSKNRYFRRELAGEIAKKTGCPVVPAMLSEGIAVNPDKDKRINLVQVIGIEEQFAALWDNAASCPDANSAVISRNTAEKLELKTGDYFLLRLTRQGLAPVNAPFVAENPGSAALRFRVKAIADDETMGRFSIRNNQAAPFNVFIPLDRMSASQELKGRANLLLMTGAANMSAGRADSLMGKVWQAADAGLDIQPLKDKTGIELTSGRIFIDDQTAKAVKSAFPASQPFLTWMVSSFSCRGKSTPYSFVTAATPDFLGTNPGPEGIIINTWLAQDLGVKAGDSLRLKYFIMGPGRQLREDSSGFVVREVRAMKDRIWDPSLMPDFPGISKAGNCSSWETGSPVDLKKIRKKDEDYWKQYRGTPKAFISLATGQKLWGNPFGNLTSVRFRGTTVETSAIGPEILKGLAPRQQGLAFTDAEAEGKRSASNSTDFGGLFISLSFFLIIAALLLVALLISLHVQSRMKEAGILSAIGFSKKSILRIMISEGLLLAMAGGIIGALFGVLYDRLLLLGLNTIWLDAVGTTGLIMKIKPATLLIGSLAGAVIVIPVILLVILKNLRKPVYTQVSARQPAETFRQKRKKEISGGLSLIFISASVALTVFLALSPGMSGSPFSLASGALMLCGGSFAIYSLLTRKLQFTSGHKESLFTLSLKNAGLNRSRSMTVIVLLALGIFTVFITSANRQTSFGNSDDPHSGSGGFLFWAESGIPLHYDPSSVFGKKEYGLEEEPALKKAGILSMQRLDGDDASCLNLNQAALPAVLGVPAKTFNQKGLFSFLALDPTVDRNNPWLALLTPPGQGILPAFADQTVITWGLQKKIGDTLFYTGDHGEKTGLKLMGGLDNSVFQGYLLISDSLFRIHFRSVAGFRNFLVSGPSTGGDSISSTLESVFRDYGMNLTPAPARLAAFNAVENTYLSVFMILGALGVLLGTIGLGLVLLRNMLERKNELAVYFALGFRRSYILRLIMGEYILVLTAGIILGLLSATAGIMPAMASPSSQLNGLFLFISASLILLNGLFWVWLSANALLRRLRSDSLSKGLAM